MLVLMQRTSQSGGMGAALGGGAAESAFGSDTNNILTKATTYGTIAFFVVSLGLFLIYQSKASEQIKELNPEELISSADPKPVEPITSDEALETPEDITGLATPAVEEAKSLIEVEAESTLEEIQAEVESEISQVEEVLAEETLTEEAPVAEAIVKEMSTETEPALDLPTDVEVPVSE